MVSRLGGPGEGKRTLRPIGGGRREPRRGARRWTRAVMTAVTLGATGLAGAVALLAGGGPAASAALFSTQVRAQASAHVGTQVDTGCALQIDGIDANSFTTPKQAFRTKVDATVAIRGASRGPSGTVKVFANVIGITVPVKDLGDSGAGPGEAWEGRIKIADYADLAVGWHHLEIHTQSCRARFWVRIYGRNPLTTLLGAISTVLAIIGAAFLLRGVHRRSWWLAAIGGIPFGIGVSLLCAQFGLIPLVIGSVAGWVAGPSVIGGAVSAARAGAAARAPTMGPGTINPSPPTPTLPHPPSPPAVDPPSTELPPPELPAPELPAPEPPAPEPPTQLPELPTQLPELPTQLPVGEGAGPSSLPPPEPPWQPGWTHAEPPWSDTPDTAGSLPTNSPAGTTDTAPTGDPPRSAFARIDAPEVVAPEAEFDVVVGLAPLPVSGVIGTELVRPEWSRGDYTLTAQVVADGFTIRNGESWRLRLPVTGAEPYPTATIHLTALAQDVATHARSVQVLYSIDGHAIGIGARSIAVVQPHGEPRVATLASMPNAAMATVAATDASASADQLLLVTDGDAPDLTIRITVGSDERLSWTFDSPIADLSVPDAPIVDTVVGDAERFATQLANQISTHEGRPGLYQHLRGVGLQIAEAMPDALWLLLAKVGRWAANQGRAPTILLLSAEPFVPWELAVVDDPWNTDAPPFLGAQATVGRWVLRRRRPSIPPPRAHTIGDVAVVWGVYDRQGWSRLYAAEEEAAHLLDALPARSVDANLPAVIDCLQGSPAVDAIHFAVHGTYDPGGGHEGLVLVDGQLLDPMTVQGAALHGAPFVYLNACQTGTGSVTLSSYSGIAAAFLYAGACAVVAPLWKIGDNAAADAAEAFYTEMLSGQAPAEVLRRQRATFSDDPDTATATMLAFQFFGNPNLRVARAEAAPLLDARPTP